MNGREFIFRIALAIEFLLWAIHNAVAVTQDPAAKDSPFRQVMWGASSLFFFLTAFAMPLIMFTRHGKIKWLMLWDPTWGGCILVTALIAAGIGVFVVAEFGLFDVQPVWFRIIILWSSFLPALWALLSYLEGRDAISG